MKIAVTGSSGMVGTALRSALTEDGHEIVRIVRREPGGPDQVHWDPMEEVRNPSALEGMDAVVHLAGKNIADHRWTASVKEQIRKSRTEGTRVLAETLAGLETKPKVLVSASAIGIYGNQRGDQVLTEESAPGDDFLARVCKGWEAATCPAQEAGIRVVNLRFGMILDQEDGALAKMLFPFKIGLGGVIGNGRQYWSWVALEDVVRAIRFAVENEELKGPVNVVAPNPATCREFTKALGKALGRPTIFPMPAFAARAVFGEMADALILGSQRVQPARLKAAGFEFRAPELAPCLKELVG